MTMHQAADLIDLAAAAAEALQATHPEVVAVRPGYRRAAQTLTEEPVLVVAVLRKLPRHLLPPERLLPDRLDGIPIDVVQADPLEIIGEPITAATWRAVHAEI